MKQNRHNIETTVYLVGAGPGDPELLTLKALRLIQEADAIIYDDLVNVQLLDHASENCVCHYVGKRCGRHYKSQDEINTLLLEYAQKYRRVVRLKGGDPMLFGRGAEEALFLCRHEVDFVVVPGISSALAGPAIAGIPLTSREINASVTIMTGHESKHSTSKINWEKLSGNLVILMGIYRLRSLVDQLLAVSGYAETTPIAVIYRATCENQHVDIFTLSELDNYLPQLKSPSVIVIGDIVYLREQLLMVKQRLTS
ncbi:MAG: uroporphyrinogen-III C-methyltransferase [Desulfobacteraceae bacterium 4572_35.1]|nr:MAG: uroporphyrinogen-III C-methyltransferase [Desulfobacteraceae bacterium 4572_35.1]